MNQTTLLRYNFRVMMLNNWLLLAFPVAVSQLTVFWLTLTRQFSLDLPAQYVEMVSPILAAFLGSHLLANEYKSRIGAILASRPVNIGRIVAMRLAVMLALVWGLALISLFALQMMMKPFDIWPAFFACVPSTLFLSLLALTFATVFRHPLTGFAVAAAFWALDLVPGSPIQPYCTLRSLSLFYAVQNNSVLDTFLREWWISKAVLLVAAVVLYVVHNRMVFLVGSPLTVRVRRRAAIGAAFGLLAYVVSGAIVKVDYGYTHRGTLPRGDLAWFRSQMSSFGPIPVAALFGPAFKAYVGDTGNPWRMSIEDTADTLGTSPDHIRALHHILDVSPGSLWAPSASSGLTQMEAKGSQKKPEEIVGYYRKMLDKFPDSPYAGNELREIAQTYSEANQAPQAAEAYAQMLKVDPKSQYRSEAFRYLFEQARTSKDTAAARQWAEKWNTVAPVHEKFEALWDIAQMHVADGDAPGARQYAQQVIAAVEEFRTAQRDEKLTISPATTTLRAQMADTCFRAAKELVK